MIKATFIKRYKRFFIDAELSNGQLITAHCPNTGSMLSCLEEGWEVMLSESDNPKRKLAYTLEFILSPSGPIMLNTIKSNRIVESFLKAKAIEELSCYTDIKREVKVGDSKIDFLLSNESEKYYLEVKSVTYLKDDRYLFPDAVSTRGQKHLNELKALVRQGHKAGILYLVNRSGSNTLAFAREIDPKYHQYAVEAKESGLDFLAYHSCFDSSEATLGSKVSICFN
ncbi:MAG: DNA/RNA nuclease SfsA [Chlamydiales bacterium]|nr:DNA/RNA nuclease SfsA [Chlamydiales bacterium]